MKNKKKKLKKKKVLKKQKITKKKVKILIKKSPSKNKK